MTEEQEKSPQSPEPMTGRLPRYRRLYRNLVVIPLLAALIPLAIMAVISNRQDASAYRAENRFIISRLLSNTKRSLQFAIEERRAVLSLIARGNSRQELSSETRLMAVLRDLREFFGDFVDLGLIDSDGNQMYYVGPYDLRGANYSGQAWFHEVSLRGGYVSDVFMGLRLLPHFVVAVAVELGDDDFYILMGDFGMSFDMVSFYLIGGVNFGKVKGQAGAKDADYNGTMFEGQVDFALDIATLYVNFRYASGEKEGKTDQGWRGMTGTTYSWAEIPSDGYFWEVNSSMSQIGGANTPSNMWAVSVGGDVKPTDTTSIALDLYYIGMLEKRTLGSK